MIESSPLPGGGTTDALIDGLAERLAPVRPQRPPVVRAGLWLGFAALLVGGLTLAMGVRPGLAAWFARPAFDLEWSGEVLTGITAALAAFTLALPDRSDRWLLLPVPALLLWLSGIGAGCLTDWVRLGPAGFEIGPSLVCFCFILVTGLPLTLLLLLMLRHAGPIRPHATACLGALAAAGVATAGLSLFHGLDTAVMSLLWHGGTAALLVAVTRLGCRGVFQRLR
jgi:hypothetical protein